jgi:ABC-type multidrug transport system ATPase subunit
MLTQLRFSPLELKIEALWVVKGGGVFASKRAILQDVSFTVEPGTFVAVIGPNGAGKTTLLRALIGERPAHGRILLYRNDGSQHEFEELYDNPEYWLQQIGYVPVDNVLHDNLTVRQALLHVGRLRLPTATDTEIDAKMRVNLVKLGFSDNDDRLDQLISTLSSGERKKVNICAELLTNPSMLLLDEPTSNLDPNAERDLMESLKNLTTLDGGSRPTILLITHTLETLNRCDQVIFIANSRKEAEGTPSDIYHDLQQRLVTANYSPLPQTPDAFEHWASIFEHYKTGDNASRRDVAPLPKEEDHPPARERQRTSDSFFRQFTILTSRYYLMRFNDLGGIFVILLTGFMAGFLMLIAPENIFLEAGDASLARQTVVLYVILVVIMGAFISHREISKEFRIYIHERSKGVSSLAYFLSKTIWLTLFIGLLSPLMILALSGGPVARVLSFIFGIILIVVGMVTLFTPHSPVRQMKGMRRNWRIVQVVLLGIPPIAAALIQVQNKVMPDYPFTPLTTELYVIVTMILVCIGAIALGLFISAAVGSNNDRATQLIIAAIILNVVLAFSALLITTPAFEQLFEFLEPLTVSHWGYRSFSSSLGIYCWAGQYRFENFNSFGHLTASQLYLVLHIIAMIALGVLALRMQETWTTRRRLLHALIVREGAVVIVISLFIAVLSIGAFLMQQSYSYFDLTFYDAMFGGTRYAHVTSVDTATNTQIIIGSFSQSQCGLPSS